MTIHHIDRLTSTQKTALELLHWCAAVARMRPDSPRLAYYASRWNVLDKIARAKAEGRYAETVAHCEPVSLQHLPAGLAALQECHSYAALYSTPTKPKQPKIRQKTPTTKSRAMLSENSTPGNDEKFIA